MLDAAAAAHDNGGVKLPLPAILLPALMLPLLTTGCGREAASPQQLTRLHQQNTEMRDKIARMEALISEAGDDIPGLADTIAQREQEVKAAVDEYCHLLDEETRVKVRVYELQNRLGAFEDEFSRLQKELANSHQ